MEQFLNARWLRNFVSNVHFSHVILSKLSSLPFLSRVSRCLTCSGCFLMPLQGRNLYEIYLSSPLACIGWFLCTKEVIERIQRIRRVREVWSILFSRYLKPPKQVAWASLYKQCLVWEVLSMCHVYNLSPLLFNQQCCGHVVFIRACSIFFSPSASKYAACNKWVFFYTVCLGSESQFPAHEL